MEEIAKFVRIEHGVKYDTLEEAVKEADVIKHYVKRLLKERSYTAHLLIGVSENDGDLGCVEEVNTGKRGRGKRVFIPYCTRLHYKNGHKDTGKNVIRKNVWEKDPHLHILLYAIHAETIAKKIVANINKRNAERTNKAREEHKVILERSKRDYIERNDKKRADKIQHKLDSGNFEASISKARHYSTKTNSVWHWINGKQVRRTEKTLIDGGKEADYIFRQSIVIRRAKLDLNGALKDFNFDDFKPRKEIV